MKPSNERFTIPDHEQDDAARIDSEGVLHTGRSCMTERIEITVAGEQR